MKIVFAGLWHLGTVMSAVFAAAGHDVVAYDDPTVIDELQAGRLPVNEPGLAELVDEQIAVGRLRYTADPNDLSACELVWITDDTPVRDDGSADADSVIERIARLLPSLQGGALVCVSSQLPVGSVAALERRAAATVPGKRLRFASSPENLRLGKAISYMRDADRYVIGIRDVDDERLLRAAFAPLSTRIESMSVESAEMTKHALNAFLATSVAFVNELAALCERTGADARDVERGLKSDVRIGRAAYLRAGGPFAGGTLARDVAFIIDLESRAGLEPIFFRGVRDANAFHATWLQRRFVETLGEPAGRTIAILGLTYKPGTDTLRASTSVAFARWFAERGGTVRAFDPAVSTLPADLREVITLAPTAVAAMTGADAAYVGTEWPEFRDLVRSDFAVLARPHVFDPNGFLSAQAEHLEIAYLAVGRESNA